MGALNRMEEKRKVILLEVSLNSSLTDIHFGGSEDVEKKEFEFKE